MSKARERRQWVLIGPTSELQHVERTTDCGRSDATFVTLRHPKKGSGARFLLTNGGRRIQEVLKYDDPPKSWLINNSVQKDGSLHLATPIDPVFLILPYLEKSKKHFTTLDNIMSCDDFPSSGCLCDVEGTAQLAHVCDVRDAVDMKVYRLNETKTLVWLQKKVDQLVAKLKEMAHVNVGSVAKAAMFVQSKRTATTQTQSDYVRYAVGIISEYLNEFWVRRLHEVYSTVFEVETPEATEPEPKKTKLDDHVTTECIEDYTKGNTATHEEPVKKVKVTVAQRSLNKVDKTGMKSISSFFHRKGKT
ncbi:ribonuclease H2 subunit B-like [Corticium candelabrum]|uniref:ribonuclease H2 subunit B-like n=1 Tax=Corticium candelabrum TaxID=121492 RepID=UPI002E257733|nr:ribonuclease H2 subunit B-like [Corticium candelabrum]